MKIKVEDVKRLLPSYGYTPSSEDETLIRLSIDTVKHRVLSFINNHFIYPELRTEVLRMCIGEFLYQKKCIGGLDEGGLSFPDRISQVTEGDTSVSFAKTEREEQVFEDMVEKMRWGDYRVLEHFRKVHW